MHQLFLFLIGGGGGGGCSEFSNFVLALVGWVPLTMMSTCLFNGCGAYCINNSGSMI